MPKKRGSSLSSEIASLLDPTPQEAIPEDDWDEPKVDTELSEEEVEELPRNGDSARLPMRADISLTQGKYIGTKSSREKLGLPALSESEESDDNEGDQDESMESDDSSSDLEGEGDSFQQAFTNMHDLKYKEAEALAIQSSKQPKPSIKLVNSIEKDLHKAQHTKNQQKIWDSLLKLRIKEQRSLTIANRFPQQEILQEFREHDSKIDEATTRISSSIQEILGSLLQVGYELRAQHTQLSNTLSNELSEVMEGTSKQSRKRKRAFFTCPDDSDPVAFYWTLLEEYHNSPSDFYKETLDHWQKKTQLANRISQTKFKAINQSLVSQVDAAMDAPQKLIERTQQLRSTGAKVLGKVQADETDATNSKTLDPEVFDDSAFYQQLLKSLIEQDVSVDPTEIARSWLKSRDQNKKKKLYDSRLSKDRVLKFNVHEKLVDFVAPTEQQPPDYADDLFQNLFK